MWGLLTLIISRKRKHKFWNNRIKSEQLNNKNVIVLFSLGGPPEGFLEAFSTLRKASWRRLGGLLETFWRPFGGLWGLFGPSWRHLERFVAQNAVKNSQRRPQEFPKTVSRGPKKPQKAAKRVPRDPQEGPKPSKIEGRPIKKWKNEGNVAVKRLTTNKDHQKCAPRPPRRAPKRHEGHWAYFCAAATGVVFGPVRPLKVLW